MGGVVSSAGGAVSSALAAFGSQKSGRDYYRALASDADYQAQYAAQAAQRQGTYLFKSAAERSRDLYAGYRQTVAAQKTALAESADPAALKSTEEIMADFGKIGDSQDNRLLIIKKKASEFLKKDKTGGLVNKLSQEDKPLITLTGKEIAEDVKDVKSFRHKAMEWYKKFLSKEKTIRQDLGEIFYPMSSAREVVGNKTGIEKMQLLPAVRDVVEKGKLVGEKTVSGRKDGIEKFYFLQGKVNIDGKEVSVQVDIAQRKDGKKFYYLSELSDKKPAQQVSAQNSAELSAGFNKEGSSATNNAGTLSTDNIAEKGQIVNPENVLKENPSEDVFINFARIDTPDDVKKVIQNIADLDKKGIDSARRGKQTFKDISLNAEQQDAWDILSKRRKGSPLNAEQSVAVRKLWAASGNKLAETAELAAKNPSNENLFMFRKMVDIHSMIQREVIAARTETARALASWKIPAGGAKEINLQLGQLLEQNGRGKLQDFAASVAKMAKEKQLEAMETLVEKSDTPGFLDMLLEYRTASLLTRATTHLVNIVGNFGTFVWDLTDRASEARLNQWLGVENGAVVGEAWAQLKGAVGAFEDALRLAKHNWQTGESAYGIGKIEVPRNAIRSGSKMFGYEIKEGTAFGKAIDMVGFTVQTPFRALEASDEFFKTIAYRGELRARALRQTEQEINKGLIKRELKETRIQELLANPPEDLRISSMSKAEYLTFTNSPNQLAKAVQGLSRHIPLMKLIVPFIRTPSNVWDFAFKHSVFAPLYTSVRQDLMAGGARATAALSKMATGSMVMSLAGSWAMDGRITGGGPENSAERKALMATGWQPYSIKIGDKYYSYRRFEPLSTVIGMAADFVEISKAMDDEMEEKSLDEIAVKLIFSTAQSVLDTNFMMGLSEFSEALNDPKRYGSNFIKSQASSFIPAVIGSDVRNYIDPYQRELGGLIDTLKNKVPGLSKSLPAKRDLFGRVMPAVSGHGVLYDAFVPVRVNPRAAEPIDVEMVNQAVYVNMPPRQVNFDGISIDLRKKPEIYSRWVELAGNELKLPEFEDMGCKDFLNNVVSGESFLSSMYEDMSDGADGDKASFIKNTIETYRKRAKEELLEEFPELARQIEAAQEAQLWNEQ